MTPTETAAKLRVFNDWRRGDDETIEPLDPREIGEAIDAAIEMIERLEKAESDALEQARLNGMGSEREAALMAKLEAAEKAKSDWLRANAPGGWIDNLRIKCDALRARIEAMERQKPVAAQQRFQRQQEMMAVWQPWQTTEIREGRPARTVDVLGLNVEYRELYLAPGAQGE